MAKVTIIGAGSVGSTIAFAMASGGYVSEIVMIDINEEKALGENKEKFAKGIFLPEEKKAKSFTTLPAKLNWISENSCNLTIQEGKFHQVRRMFLAMNNKVSFLKRVAIGKLNLDESLQQGNYRKLTDEEKKLLIQE